MTGMRRNNYCNSVLRYQNEVQRRNRPNRNQVLVLAAHPDDETLGCGGTIARFSRKGHEILLITFTDGVGARNDNQEDRNNVLPQVCERLGIQHYASGRFPDNRMDTVPLLEIVQFIEEQLREFNFNPSVVFTHHPGCLNVDHQLVHRATMTAFRPQNSRERRVIYSYFVPSSTDYNPMNEFQGNVYFRLNNCDVVRKLTALRVYNHEMRPYPHTRSYQNIRNLINVWGSEIGVRNAEKFQLMRDIR